MSFIFEDDLNQEIYEIKNFDLTIRCEPNKINPVGLFYALGLLTIDKVKDDKVILKIPNIDTKNYLNENLLETLIKYADTKSR